MPTPLHVSEIRQHLSDSVARLFDFHVGDERRVLHELAVAVARGRGRGHHASARADGEVSAVAPSAASDRALVRGLKDAKRLLRAERLGKFVKTLLVGPCDGSLQVRRGLVGTRRGFVAIFARAICAFVSALRAVERFGAATSEIPL